MSAFAGAVRPRAPPRSAAPPVPGVECILSSSFDGFTLALFAIAPSPAAPSHGSFRFASPSPCGPTPPFASPAGNVEALLAPLARSVTRLLSAARRSAGVGLFSTSGSLPRRRLTLSAWSAKEMERWEFLAARRDWASALAATCAYPGPSPGPRIAPSARRARWTSCVSRVARELPGELLRPRISCPPTRSPATSWGPPLPLAGCACPSLLPPAPPPALPSASR